jgi:hypothetical protein
MRRHPLAPVGVATSLPKQRGRIQCSQILCRSVIYEAHDHPRHATGALPEQSKPERPHGVGLCAAPSRRIPSPGRCAAYSLSIHEAGEKCKGEGGACRFISPSVRADGTARAGRRFRAGA